MPTGLQEPKQRIGFEISLATDLVKFLSQFQAPAKRSQHFNATYRNIVGCNMLRAFGHPVATC